jgi:hypothetical protein
MSRNSEGSHISLEEAEDTKILNYKQAHKFLRNFAKALGQPTLYNKENAEV